MVEIFSDADLAVHRRPAPDLLRVAVTPAGEEALPDHFPKPAATRTAVSGDAVGWWLGPRQYLVQAPAAWRDGLAAMLDDADAILATQDGAYEWMEIEGAAAPALLARGCALDLHDRVSPAGFAGRTLLAELPVLLHKRSGAPLPSFAVLVDQSRADILADWLAVTARDLTRNAG